MHHKLQLPLILLTLLLPACPATAPVPKTPRTTPPAEAPEKARTPPRVVTQPVDQPHTLHLSGEAAVAVPGTTLTVQISESSAKIGAPVSRVNVLARDGKLMAEAGWVIESGKYDVNWQPIAGRFWNPDAREYQEGSLPGWELRLVSLDDFHSNGSPAAVTIELRRTPAGN